MKRLAPYLVAAAIALAFFTAIELVRPYYFFQDDNRDIFVPLYLHNYRAAADGQLAQYNFYQSLGRPHFGSGQVAALHPVPYVSIFLSFAVFGHVFAAADILALIYLLMGATGAVFLARTIGLSNVTAVFASVAWTYTPFNMLVSQSWTTYPPVIGTLPWIVAAALLLYRGRYRLGGTIFVVAHLLLIYVGAPQFVLYAGFVEGGLVVALAALHLRARCLDRASALRTVGVYALLVVLITGLSMPLLYPMWKHTQLSAFRSQTMSHTALSVCSIGVVQLINGLILPAYRFYEGAGGLWCGTNFPASFTHQGYLVTILLLAYFWARRKLETEQRRVLDASMIVALVLALAMFGWLTHIIAMIPVANRFRWPFKYFGFANLLVVMCAAGAFEVLRTRLKTMLAAALLIALQLVNVTFLDLTFPTQAFFEHTDPVPLQEPLRERFGSGRILSFGWRGGAQAATVATVGYDYATLWELHYLGGYDPLVPARNLKFTYALDYTAIINLPREKVLLDYNRFWGVRWYVVNKPYGRPYEPLFVHAGFRRVHEEPRRIVYEDPLAPPLVSSADCTTRSIGRIGDDLTATVDCRRDTELRLRFLYQPYFAATIDGRPAALEPKVSQQMTMRVPAGVHEIRVAYDDPNIDIGVSIAAFTAAAGLLALIVLRRRRVIHTAAG